MIESAGDEVASRKRERPICAGCERPLYPRDLIAGNHARDHCQRYWCGSCVHTIIKRLPAKKREMLHVMDQLASAMAVQGWVMGWHGDMDSFHRFVNLARYIQNETLEHAGLEEMDLDIHDCGNEQHTVDTDWGSAVID